MITGFCREVLEKSEWVAIATTGPTGPHIVATWSDYIRRLGVGETLLAPAGGFEQTEKNLKDNPRIELLASTRLVTGFAGPGAGCLLKGRAEIQYEGSHFDAVKSKFPWARAALVIKVEDTEGLLKPTVKE